MEVQNPKAPEISKGGMVIGLSSEACYYPSSREWIVFILALDLLDNFLQWKIEVIA